MKFMFFTFDYLRNWEDVYNYQNWVIQKHIKSNTYRLLDPHNIRRHSGSFEQCRDLLMEYIAGYEVDSPYDDSIILLPGFGQSRRSMSKLIESLKEIPANIIVYNNVALKADLNYHANMLTQFLKNLDINGKISFITTNVGGLILRKMISNSNNYRNYKIHRILEINPLNSGSDLADLMERNPLFIKLTGPMINDISPKKLVSLAKLPRDIEHGILFCPLAWKSFFKRMFSRYDSFPISSRPTEESFALHIKKLADPLSEPLNDSEVIEYCKSFILQGNFGEDDTPNPSAQI